jgi:hypothetical protein
MKLLSNNERQILCHKSKLIQFNDQDKIIFKDHLDKTVYMLKSGNAQAITSDGTIVIT